MNLTDELIEKGFIRSVNIKNEQVFILTTPCKFIVLKEMVMKLKVNYLDYEEIGGVMQAKPTIENGEMVYVVDKVEFVRNAIEDNEIVGEDGKILNKSNAYLEDRLEYDGKREQILNARCLPIFFHTHPTRGTTLFENISNQKIQTNTSEPDRRHSKKFDLIDMKNILIPRGLVVGNKDLGDDLFLGLYDGFIAPAGFEESKRKVEQENMMSIGNSISDGISSWNLSKNEKIALGIGAALMLGGIYHTRKYSVPVIFGLGILGVALLATSATTTTTIERPNYYNRLLFGDAHIYIPKEDGEYFPK